MVMQKGICEECGKEYDYEYNPKYPRKYCHECSAKKKAEYEGAEEKVPVVKPGFPVKVAQNDSNKYTTMYVSYAKDIFCVLMPCDKNVHTTEDIMKVSIELVKQAREEFS